MALLGLLPDMPKKGVSLKMTPAEARTEAIGKALGLVGTTMGAIGTVMALTANPAVKQTADGVFAQIPKEVQDQKILIMVGATAVITLLIARRVRKMTKERYQ